MRKSYITEILAERIKNTEFSSTSKEVIEKAEYCILDSIGCTLNGAKTKIGEIIIKTLVNNKSNSKNYFSIIGSKKKTEELNAIFINTSTSNILDYDDYYIGHPGCTIIPIAFNLAEEIKASGEDIINSVCLAYDIMLKIALGVRNKEERRYIHGHSTWQIFGSVIVASKLLDLDINEIVNALGISGCNAPIPSVMKSIYGENGPSMVKNTYGIASVSGIISVKLAKNGFTGPKDVFEGKTGFWRMIGSDTNLIKEKIEDHFDENLILKVGFKPYPCCRLIHSSVEATNNIMGESDFIDLDIKEIKIKTIAALCKPPFSNATPKDFYSGIFSLPYVIACNLKRIEKLRWFEEKNFINKEINSLAKKVSIERDNDADYQFQIDQGKITSIVEIFFKNGKKKFAKVDIPFGDPRKPMTSLQLKEKFLSLSYKNITESKSLIDLIMKLENIKDLNNLMSHLCY